MSALARYIVERSLSNVSELSGRRWSRWRGRQHADDFRCTIVSRHAWRPRAEHRLTRKGSHPPSARTAVQSPRASSQPRPKRIPVLKSNPPSPQRWPLRHRHPTVTAGQVGNDVSLRSLWRWIPCRCRDGWGERGLGRGWDGCGSAVTDIRARKAQSRQGAADPCDAPNGQER